MLTSRRNRMAGKHSSYKERGMSEDAIASKREYDKKYHATINRKKYRAMLNTARRAGIRKKAVAVGDGNDMSHRVSFKTAGLRSFKHGLRVESQSVNRARKT